MEEYPEELRTPPVALACLVGQPDLHQPISAFLNAEQPPMNTLALPDFSKLALLARKQREGSDPAEAVGGILKRGWLLKHRTRVPAVVAALLSVDRLDGDHSGLWQQVCADLDTVKAVVRGRNMKLVLVLVQASLRDISEDLISAIKKRAEIDSKYILSFVQRDILEHQQSLNRIAGVFAELSNMHYREEGRRVKARIDKKNLNSIELNIRYSFKAAIYAEFRRDWAEALRLYEDGYRILREMVGISLRLPPIQRLVEVKTVAEQFHFKMSTLLLHGGKVGEAVIWFHKHIASYETLTGNLEVSFLHWEWLSRQFLVFAELIETSSASVPTSISTRFGTSDNPLTEWEFEPAYYYQLAAQYLRQKRESLNYSLALSDASELSSVSESIISSEFVGQFARLIEEGNTVVTFPLVDAEYTHYALSEGKRFQDSFEIIALLRKSLESFNNLKSQRMASYCANRMAKEHFSLSEYGNAKQLFDGVVGHYRQEGWIMLLWDCLGYLKECSKKLHLPKDFIEYSLEMASLPIFSSDDTKIHNAEGVCGPAGVPSLLQRQRTQDEVLKLLKREPPFVSTDGSCDLKLDEGDLIHLEIDPISPLRSSFLVSVAFHKQSIKPGASTLLTLAILTLLPNPVEIDQLNIQFNQPECNFVVGDGHGNDVTGASVDGIESVDYDGSVEYVPPALRLETNKWLRLTHEVKPVRSGKLECLAVVVNLGHHLSVHCQAESTASMGDLPLWKFEDWRLPFPTKDPFFSYSGQKFIQVEEPDPQVNLLLNSTGPALVGEIFTIPVTIASKGHAVHSGELKVTIVDAGGGGLMSPREAESLSSGSHHVELLTISGLTEDNDSSNGRDSIKEVKQSFGLVSVPFLDAGACWHGKIEIKWHRPKAVMFYISLSYSPNDSEGSSLKVEVHKNLQIEGKIPIIISHRFMLPFRREPLLLPWVKEKSDSSETRSLALDESSILLVSARNCCEVPLRLICITVSGDASSKCVISRLGGTSSELALLPPGVEFKQVFSVTPHVQGSKVELGCIFVEWRRDSMLDQKSDSHIVTTQKLPVVCVDRPPLIVSWECPPHAVVGVPFMVYVKLQNLTSFLQDIKFSLGDLQSFVFCGSHSDSASILPKTEHIIPYKLIPLSSGHQQLPQFTLTSVRYSAGFYPSAASSTIFVFPSEPNFDVKEYNTTAEQTVAVGDAD